MRSARQLLFAVHCLLSFVIVYMQILFSLKCIESGIAAAGVLLPWQEDHRPSTSVRDGSGLGARGSGLGARGSGATYGATPQEIATPSAPSQS